MVKFITIYNKTFEFLHGSCYLLISFDTNVCSKGLVLLNGCVPLTDSDTTNKDLEINK